MARQIHPQLAHDPDGQRVYPRLFGTRALHLEAIAGECRRKPSAIWLRAELWVQRNSTLRLVIP